MVPEPGRRRQLILEAAARLFRHYGHGKTTMADLAREADVAVGSVYLDFPSKEAIVEELSSRAHVRVLDAMRHAARKNGQSFAPCRRTARRPASRSSPLSSRSSPGRRVLPDMAMTGECTLRGRVLPVGGIKAKVLAAHRAGIKRVILPTRCGRDLDEVPEEVRRELEIVLVDDMSEVLGAALEREPSDAPLAFGPARVGQPSAPTLTAV